MVVLKSRKSCVITIDHTHEHKIDAHALATATGKVK